MRDLTNRALDTATAQGATYADVRVVRRREEHITVKSGRVEGVAVGETEGFGVRVSSTAPGASPRASHLDAPPRRTGSPPRPCASRAPAPPRSATPVGLDDRPPAHGPLRDAGAEDPFAVPMDRKIARPPGRGRGHERGHGHRLHRDPVHAPAGVEDVRRHATAPTRSRSSRTSARASRPTPSRATSSSAAPTRTTAAATGRPATSTSAALDLAGHAERAREEAVELLSRPAAARRAAHDRARTPRQLYLQVHESCGHPTELDRVFGTEASYAGTSFLTPDKLGTLPLRLGAVRHRGRRHGRRAAWAPSAGTTRACRAAGAAGQGGHLRRLPD